MEASLIVIIGVVGAVLLGFAAYALGMGVIGAALGARFERCPRCHHHALVTTGKVHQHGCPEPRAHVGQVMGDVFGHRLVHH